MTTINEQLIDQLGGLDSLALATDDFYRINPDRVSDIAELLQSTIADLIATIIDAGSERDAVNEDEALRTALINTLNDW